MSLFWQIVVLILVFTIAEVCEILLFRKDIARIKREIERACSGIISQREEKKNNG